jgi:anti-anti-sigma factor
VAFTFDSRRVGDLVVVTCDGRLVAGEETAAFQKYLDELIDVNPRILLHLGKVDFVDSAGLGMLVRYLTRAQNASGALRICAVSPSVDRVLTVSRLKPVLQPFDSEGQAIADAHKAGRDAFAAPDVLCVDDSHDVLAYLRELLRSDGHRATTASNLPDAVILLSAIRPRVVVIGASLGAAEGTRSADEFRRLSARCARVDLPPGFARQEAGEAAQHVLAAVRGHTAKSG